LRVAYLLTQSESGQFLDESQIGFGYVSLSGASHVIEIPTAGDSTDEPDGSISMALVVTNSTSAYSRGTPRTHKVTVRDDDPPPVEVDDDEDDEAPPVSECGSADALAAEARASHDALPNTAANRKERNDWWRAWIALSGTTGTYNTPLTAAEARVLESGDSRWTPYRSALECLEGAPPPVVVPEVSVTAGSGVTEGGDAVFTVTASPAPSAPLSVDVTVAQTGDFGVATGSRTVTVPTSGSAALTVGTSEDSVDETDGSVSVSVGAGSGYTVSGTAGSATVNVADDDDPPPATPEISVTAGDGVTEGGDASFTVSASPAPAQPLSVSVTVTQQGDHGATTGSRTVTVGTGGTVTFTVATADDDTDETDGSVTVTINSGDGYTVSSTAASASVAVSDDDDPPPLDVPEVSVADGSVVEGAFGPLSPLEFSVTLSEVSEQDVTVRYTIRSGTAFNGLDYWGGSGQVTIWAGFTSATIGVNVKDDTRRESDETLTVELTGADGAVIADGARTATGTIIDND
ncbi:MAG: hypothetical protein F4200_09420, partial [Acidimicrobiales bacterium]|nr:hypothetical protein [Acidimicrobiales bacterium]